MTSSQTNFWQQRQLELITLRLSGKTLTEIAFLLGVTKGQVCGQIHQLKNKGLIPPTKQFGAGVSNREVIWTPKMDRTLATERDLRRSWQQIAGTMGLAVTTVRKRARAIGLSTDGRRNKVWTEEIFASVVALVDQGLSRSVIAERLSSTSDVIGGVIRFLRQNGRIADNACRDAHRRRIDQARAARKAAKITAAQKRKAQSASARKKLPKAEKLKAKRAERQPVVRASSFVEAESYFIPLLGRHTLSLMDLGLFHCRWPFVCDGGEVRYCAESSTDGSYCSEHGARAFLSASRPKDVPFRLRTHGVGEIRP